MRFLAEVNLHAAPERQPIYDIPTIREYFIDLEYVLSVISDGPTKSFAFRRLGYLQSKFTTGTSALRKVAACLELVSPIPWSFYTARSGNKT